jgi:hypothetical protein
MPSNYYCTKCGGRWLPPASGADESKFCPFCCRDMLKDERDRLNVRLTEVEATLERLPKTRDYSPIVPGMHVWVHDQF